MAAVVIAIFYRVEVRLLLKRFKKGKSDPLNWNSMMIKWWLRPELLPSFSLEDSADTTLPPSIGWGVRTC